MTELPAPTAPVPLDLVTGFLGSGKTTLVNAVLRDASFSGTVVIVNEFGEIGLDQLLVGSAADDVVLLDSGCLCCAASGSLRDTLIDLFSRRASGRLPPFTRVIVETSGLANPAPMIASLLGDSALAPRCRLAQVLTLVDSVHGAATLQRYPEAQRQVALADRLLLGKADLSDTAQRMVLSDAVRSLNPHAPIFEWRSTDVPAPHFQPLDLTGRPAADRGSWLRGPLRAQYGAHEEASHGSAFAQITTHVLHHAQTLDWPGYAAWTAELSRHFGTRLLRCKGLLAIAHEDDAWIVQGVQGHFAPPRRLGAWPSSVPRGFLVCIGEGIGRAELDETLRSIPS